MARQHHETPTPTPRRRTIPKPVAMLLVFGLPIVMMSALFYAIANYGSMTSPMDDAPPVGAGAGETGMTNQYRSSTSGSESNPESGGAGKDSPASGSDSENAPQDEPPDDPEDPDATGTPPDRPGN